MRPPKSIKKNTVIILFVIIITVSLYLFFNQQRAIKIADAHVINMDKSVARLNEIQASAKKANLEITRGPGVDGSTITYDDIRPKKLSALIMRYTTENKQPGVIGCFLSHQSLLKYLETQSASSTSAHLILEDDAHIPADFWEQWNRFSPEVPRDWDIIQLGVTHPNLKLVDGKQYVHTHATENGNVGAFAYVVKHGSLKMINAHLEYMSDPIDNKIRDKQDEWKIYFAWPEICPHNDHGTSTIRG